MRGGAVGSRQGFGPPSWLQNRCVFNGILGISARFCSRCDVFGRCFPRHRRPTPRTQSRPPLSRAQDVLRSCTCTTGYSVVGSAADCAAIAADMSATCPFKGALKELNRSKSPIHLIVRYGGVSNYASGTPSPVRRPREIL